MLMEKIEEQSFNLSYGYLYLWSSDEEIALPFYRKIRYLPCESISSDVDSLKHLTDENISKIENIFLKRLSINKVLDNSPNIWLRKRLIHEFPIIPINQEFLLQEIKLLINKLEFDIDYKLYCSYPTFPWVRVVFLLT
jgi:hypothetical protein